MPSLEDCNESIAMSKMAMSLEDAMRAKRSPSEARRSEARARRSEARGQTMHARGRGDLLNALSSVVAEEPVLQTGEQDGGTILSML